MKKRLLFIPLLTLALSAVLTLVPTAAEIGDGILPSRADTKENYDALYVPGYTTKWDGFELTEGSVLNTDIFGGGAIAGNSSLHLPKTALDLSAYLPYDHESSTPELDFTLDATVALRPSTFSPDNSACRLFIGAYAGHNGGNHGVQVFLKTAISSYPANETFGQISGTYTAYTNPSGGLAQFETDTSEKNRFLSGLRGEIYSFAVATDYSISGKSATISLFRDGKQIKSAAVAYPLRNGATVDQTGYIKIPAELQFDYYALRIYPFALKAEELQQNHFADLCKYFGVSLDVYETYPETTKKALHEALGKETFQTLTKAELQSIIDGYGVFDEAFSADTVLKFEGFQGKLAVNPGIRSIYTVNTEAIKVLEKKGYSVTVGALMAIANGRESHEILLGCENSEQIVVYKNGSITAKKTLTEGEHGFSFGFATVFDKSEDAAHFCDKILYRGYVTLTKGERSATFYLDTDTEMTEDQSLSLFELYTLLSFLGYDDSPLVESVVGERVISAASALKTDFAHLYGAKSEMRTLAKDVAFYTRYALTIRASALGKDRAYARLSAGLSYNETLDALLECENAILAVKLCRDQLTRLQGEALALKTRLDGTAAFLSRLDALCGTDAELVRSVLSYPLEVASTVAENRLLDFDVQKTALDRIYSGTESHRTTVERVRQEILTVNDPLAFATNVRLSSYAILTSEADAPAARMLQAMLAKLYGVVIPYVYGMPATLAVPHAIHLQTKDIGDKDYVIAREGASALLLGSSTSNTLLSAAVFVQGCEKDALTLTPSVGEHIPDLFQAGLPSYLKKLNVPSLESGGVYARFEAVSAAFGAELAVIKPLSSSDYPRSCAHTYFVSPNGSDDNVGTKDSPFKTLQHALNQAIATGGAQIVLRGGRYVIEDTVEIGTLHGGTKQSPLYITAYPGETVTFTAADTVKGSAFSPVTDQAVIARLNTFIENNAENVYVADLASLGITDYPTPTTQGEPVLLRGNNSLHLSRYPNAGTHESDGRTALYTGESDILKQCKVTNNGSHLYEAYKNETDDWKMRASAEFGTRAKLWQSENIWLYGAIHEEWWRKHMPVSFACETVGGEANVFTMSSTVRCDWGLQYKKNNDGYFYNILEELDADGEWYLDAERGLLYVYAKDGIDRSERFTLSGRSTVLLSVKNTQSIVVNGITFAETLSYAACIENAEYVLFQNCSFRDTRSYAILTSDVRNVGIITSRFERIGNSAIFMRGIRDQATMTPDRNVIQNCSFLSCNVILQDIGSLVSHNLFDRTSLQCSGAIEAVIEYNEFNRGPQAALDAGPIYCAGSSFGGNHIRYNYIHDLDHSLYGVYLDSFSCGVYVYSNIITYAEGHTGRCVNVHGGNMHVIRGNVCVGGGSSTYAAINESANFYVQHITESGMRRKCDIIRIIGGNETAFKTTDAGWVGGVWLTSVTSRYQAYLEHGGASSRYAERFPFAVAYNELLGICLADIKAKGASYDAYSATWTHGEGDPAFGEDGFYAWLTADGHEGDLEIFLRSTLGTSIESNILIGCEMDIQKVTDYGVDSSTMENNYSLTKDSEYYTQVRRGDLSAFSDEDAWQTLAPGFRAINTERLGVLEMADVSIALPNTDTETEKDPDIKVDFDDLLG